MVKAAILLAFAGFVSARWEATHEYSPSVSNEIATAIKDKLLANIGRFADRDFAKSLENDLNESDDSKRTLKQLSVVSANQLFSVLNLDDPKCDQNGDGVIKGDELKCLNYAWKAYLPQ